MKTRSSKHNITNTDEDKERIRKMLKKSADIDSSSESNSEIEESDSDDNSFIEGVYADDYHPEKKSVKPKKKPIETVEGQTSLQEFINKQANKKARKDNTVQKKKEGNNIDIGLQNMLNELNDSEDEEQTRRKSRKTKQQQNVKKNNAFPSFIRKEYENPQKETTDLKQKVKVEEKKEVKVEEKKEVVEEKKEVVEEKEQPKQVILDIEPVQESTLNFEADTMLSSDQLVELDISDGCTIDAFLFHVHEESRKLFMFCKYLHEDRYITICIQISTPSYYLQFLPIPGHEEELKEEVQKIARKCKGAIISMDYQEKNYAFENLSIPKHTKWLCVAFTSKLQIADIPRNGDNYSQVLGLTSSLSESFILKQKLRGPSWITISNPKKINQISSVPILAIPNISYINTIPLNQQPPHIPYLNLCTMAMRTLHNEKNNENEIFLISLRIHYKWNIETFQQSGEKQMVKSITFACSPSTTSLSTHYCMNVSKRDDIKICKNEAELLSSFVEIIDKYDIDLISSFGLTSFDGPVLIERMKKTNLRNWWKLGRLQRLNPKGSKANFLTVISGRIPVDLRISCSEFLRVKDTNFSTIVKEQLNEDRQQIDHFSFQDKLSDKQSLENIVNYTIRDSVFVSRLLKEIQVLPLTLQISQLSGCQWSRVLLGSATPRCESLLLHEFSQRNFVLPEKIVGKFSTKRESKYKGGMVLEPQRGFYDTCIIVLDFNSLYPSIIREYNICFTTVDRENPNADVSKNSKIHGVLPSIMTDLLGARKSIKLETAKLKKQQDSYNQKSKEYLEIAHKLNKLSIKEQAIKVLANSMYGYLGFKGSRFQAKELAALITEKGREILNNTKIAMENKQYQVIYGDTDSVMVNTRTKDVNEARRIAIQLSDLISKNYKCLVLGIDYIFEKMLLVKKKKYAAFVHEDSPRKSHLETKGLDMVRRDWSPLTKSLSSYIIGEFMSTKTNESDDAVTEIIKELEAIAEMMRNGGKPVEGSEKISKSHPDGISLSKLFISKTLKKSVEKYPESDKAPHVTVARELLKKGIPLPPNETIKYVICKSDDKLISEKAKYYLDVQSFDEVDVEWYLQHQVLSPLWKLCEPFGGIQRNQLTNALGLVDNTISYDNSQRENMSYSSIPTVLTLKYKCSECGEDIIITPDFNQVINCPKCQFHHNWKYVANQLTREIHMFLCSTAETKIPKINEYKCDNYMCSYKTMQLPVTSKFIPHYNQYKDGKSCKGKLEQVLLPSDIYQTLRYCRTIFEKPNQTTSNEFDDFRQYMYDNINDIIKSHGFSKISFSKFLQQ